MRTWLLVSLLVATGAAAQPEPAREPPPTLAPPPLPEAPRSPEPIELPPPETDYPEAPESRRTGHAWVAGEGLVPLSARFGVAGFGAGVAVGSWLDFGGALASWRLAAHFGPGPSEASFFHLLADFGVAWAPVQGPVTPLVGGGIGLAFLSVRGPTVVETSGSVLELTTRSWTQDARLGFSGYLRGGLWFLREAPVSFAVGADAVGALLGPGGPANALLAWVGVVL